MRGGILDCRCARRSARRQVGTKGWSYSDRTKGCALELNSTALAHHAQFAELDAHNYRSTLARIDEIVPRGEFATWRAARAVGDYDLNTFVVRADPVGSDGGIQAG
jgi:hypothetical protein